MNIAAETKQLLQQYYGLSEGLPEQRIKSKWMPENNFGFLLGIIAYGDDTHITQLHSLLQNNQFKDQEQYFIGFMFDWYIRPFHKSYNNSESCRTPSIVSLTTSSTEENELAHKDLKTAVKKRDDVCLFCWDILSLEGAHIIAQKNIAIQYDESSILHRAGLIQKHQVQNGLLLCIKCHSQFDKLKRYVDVVDGKLVVRIVNESNDLGSYKHKMWYQSSRRLKGERDFSEKYWILIDNRKAVESNKEMALYFVENDQTILPNRNALEFHKTACLIWRMAGGSEPDEEYCSDDYYDDDDDEQGPVDTAALRKRFKLAQDYYQL